MKTKTQGAHEDMPSPTAGASTLSERNTLPKKGNPLRKAMAPDGSLESKRVNSAGIRGAWLL